MKKSIKQLALVSAIAAISMSNTHAANYSSRIIGGSEAPSDTYPWMVSVQSSEEGEHFCGGSLISNTHVLTAAHCLEDASADDIRVVVSEFDLSSQSSSEETIQAKALYIPEDYGDDHDIAIIELASPSSKTPVKLADTALQTSLSVGSNLKVMGWGNTLSEGENYPNVLREVQVPLADQQQCATNYEQVDIDITDNMICAGLAEGGKDSCQGDSGGPLLYQKDTDWFQTGVVSFGEGCAIPEYYGVYTKVSNYGEWIASVQAGEVDPFEADSDDEQDEWNDDLDGDWEDDFDGGWDDEYAGHDDDYGDHDDEDEYGEDYWDDEGDEYEEELQAFELPEYLGFLAFEGEDVVEESLFVFNTEETPLAIQGVTLDNDQHFSIVENGCDAMTLNSEEECEIVLSYSASEDEFHEANLSIATSSSEDGTVDVELFGEVVHELEHDDDFDGMDGTDDEEWYIEADDAWVADSEDDEFNLAVDTVAENDEAMLMTELEGPGVLEFDMSLTGDAAGNSLSFVVDGEVVTSLSSERDNNGHSVELSEGEHQVAWIYRKTETSPSGAEATVSDIEFEPEFDEGSEDDFNDEFEGEFDDEFDGNEGLDEDQVSDAIDTLSEAISGAGSTDVFLLALLATLGVTARARKK